MQPFPTLPLLLSLLSLPPAGAAQEVADYRIRIDKRNASEANARFECRFTLTPPPGADSVAMAFGGNLEELAVDELTVEGENLARYAYDPERRTLTLYPAAEGPITVEMHYVYTNFSGFFIYGESGAELWETGFGEYYYPQFPDRRTDLSAELLLPDSLLPVCAFPVRRTAPSRYGFRAEEAPLPALSFALLRRALYSRQTIAIPDTVTVWQLRGREASAERLSELEELAAASIAWFGRMYGEEYVTEQVGLPTFLFHGGKGFANRNNYGFISASQEKFAAYPDLYPLIHEIGHRWLGEWTLLIPDGEAGAYFIKESLNEWMTLQFIRHRFGEETYAACMERCSRAYARIAGTAADRPLLCMTRNDNDTIVYRKGPLLLDALARRYGYEALTAAIAGFYREWRSRPGLTCEKFLTSLDRSLPEAAAELEAQLRNA